MNYIKLIVIKKNFIQLSWFLSQKVSDFIYFSNNGIFFQTQPKSDVFPYNVPVRRLSRSDVCSSPTFVPVRRL